MNVVDVCFWLVVCRVLWFLFELSWVYSLVGVALFVCALFVLDLF